MTTPSSIQPRDRNDNDPHNEMNMDVDMDEVSLHMTECKNSLREMMESVEDLTDQGSIPSGSYVRLSNNIKTIFDNLGELEEFAAERGAQMVVHQALIDDPRAAQLANHQVKLQSVSFVVSLVTIKVETIRIKRRELEEGPILGDMEVFVLENWANKLVDHALSCWQWHFRCSRGCRCAVYGKDRPDKQVPNRFKSLVFALIRMQLDVFPNVILPMLHSWGVASSNIFPESSWDYEELLNATSCEPRMIPFVIGHSDLDMNGLASLGPRLRSNKSQVPPNLNPDQLWLLERGVEKIQNSFNGNMRKQKAEPWRAWNFTWPRSELPTEEELLGVYF